MSHTPFTYPMEDKVESALKQADVLLQPITYVVAGMSFFGDLSLSDGVLMTALVTGLFNGFFAAVRFIDYWKKVFGKKQSGVEDDRCG